MQWLLSCYTQRTALSGLQSNRRSQNSFLDFLNFTTCWLTRHGGLLLLSIARKIFLAPLGGKNPHRSYWSRSCKFKWLRGHAEGDTEENMLVMTHPRETLNASVTQLSRLAWFSRRNEESPMSTQLRLREKRQTLMCVISRCVPLHTHARRGGSAPSCVPATAMTPSSLERHWTEILAGHSAFICLWLHTSIIDYPILQMPVYSCLLPILFSRQGLLYVWITNAISFIIYTFKDLISN